MGNEMKKPILTLLVGPPGSGKSTMSKGLFYEAGLHVAYINQDSQGKEHYTKFMHAIAESRDIIVDRMNFEKRQRNRYIGPARTNGYHIKIIVLHEPHKVCLERMLKRENHETIRDREGAEGALRFFFKNYERVEDSEADEVERRWPKGKKFPAIISDLDGTLCNVEHRRHFVRSEGKKDWASFFGGIKDDTVNDVVARILEKFKHDGNIVYCTGRGNEYEHATKNWLVKKDLWDICNENLFMRQEGDFRSDDIVKEIILDFEILTRFEPRFILDDRNSVVEMWRRRGYTCLQVANGDF
jgi:adenylate kinase family enzyme